MKMMKYSLLVITMLTIALSAVAQVGGVSASKIITLCPETVGKNMLEFEPSFGLTKSHKQWNGDGNLVNSYASNDSAMVSSGLNFRLTYGISNKLELGVIIPTDVSELASGVKFHLLDGETLGASFVGGITIPVDNENAIRTARKRERVTTPLWGIGGVLEYKLSTNASIDFDVQYQSHVAQTNDQHKQYLFSSAEIGWYVVDGLQLCAGSCFSGAYFSAKEANEYVLCVYPGLTIERANNYLIVVNPLFGILGKNAPKETGFNVAFTIAFN